MAKSPKKKTLGMGMQDLLKITLDKEILPKDQIKLHEEKDKQIKNLEKKLSTIEKKVQIDEIFQQGVHALKEGNILKALELFSTVLYFDPQHIKSIINSGVILFEMGAENFAKQRFREALALDPENKTALENLELIKSMAGEPDG